MAKWGPAVRLIGAAFYIGICIFLGVFVGYWLDNKFNTRPILLLVGLIVGLVLAFWGLYQMVIPLLKENNKTDNKNNKRGRSNQCLKKRYWDVLFPSFNYRCLSW
jgi:F0F1-type ATP synthase assembly protein I